MPLNTKSVSALLPLLLVAIAIVVMIVVLTLVGRDPVVETVGPGQLAPGDTVVIRGRHFGETFGTVSLAGSDIPASSIDLWSDTEIRLTAPVGVSSGLLFVTTERGISQGALLQVVQDVPSASDVSLPGAPSVDSLSSERVVIGQLLTLRGANFGPNRLSSTVDFPTEVPCGALCGQEISYAAWSDTSITVRVPDGVVDGLISVSTGWGRSNPARLIVERPVGSAVYTDRREIALRYTIVVSDLVRQGPTNQNPSPGDDALTLLLPVPPETVLQRDVRVIDSRGGQQVEAVGSSELVRYRASDDPLTGTVVRTVIVDRRAATFDTAAGKSNLQSESDSGFHQHFTRELPHLPLGIAGVAEPALSLARNYPNPYRRAQGAYQFVLDTLEYHLDATRSVEQALTDEIGNHYSYAALFTALCRAADVPSRLVSGLLVTDAADVYPHFWAEFFVQGIGWIPADPALGDGGFPGSFPIPDEYGSFYFGSLDSYRVTLQRGYDEIPIVEGTTRINPQDPYVLYGAAAVLGQDASVSAVEWPTPELVGMYPWTPETVLD